MYGLSKVKIFVKNGHFGQGSGKIGNFVVIVTLSERKKYVKNSDLIAYRKKIARIPIAEFKLRSLFYPTPVTPWRRGRRTNERHARSAFSKGC